MSQAFTRVLIGEDSADHFAIRVASPTKVLMRTRREQPSASQLMRKNPTEAIVDKDNHLRDALKYFLLSLPSPTEPLKHGERDRIIREAFETGTQGTLGVRLAQFDELGTCEGRTSFVQARLADQRRILTQARTVRA